MFVSNPATVGAMAILELMIALTNTNFAESAKLVNRQTAQFRKSPHYNSVANTDDLSDVPGL